MQSDPKQVQKTLFRAVSRLKDDFETGEGSTRTADLGIIENRVDLVLELLSTSKRGYHYPPGVPDWTDLIPWLAWLEEGLSVTDLARKYYIKTYGDKLATARTRAWRAVNRVEKFFTPKAALQKMGSDSRTLSRLLGCSTEELERRRRVAAELLEDFRRGAAEARPAGRAPSVTTGKRPGHVPSRLRCNSPKPPSRER